MSAFSLLPGTSVKHMELQNEKKKPKSSSLIDLFS